MWWPIISEIWGLHLYDRFYGSKSMDQRIENSIPFFEFGFLAKLAKLINFGMHSNMMGKICYLAVWRLTYVGTLGLDSDFKTWSTSTTSELYLIRLRHWNLFQVALTVLAVWQTVLEWNVVSSRVLWLLSPPRKDCRPK